MSEEIPVSGTDSPPPDSPAPATLSSPVTTTSPASTIGRLTKIEIENYRGFRGRFELELPDGCNLLVYGENGAGKSSLFHALSDFIESPERKIYDTKTNTLRALKCDDHRHFFCDDKDVPFIRLSFKGNTAGHDNNYEWNPTKNEAYTSEMRTINKVKGFLDYKSLLRVHLLPLGQREVNMFDLFINTLLANYKNPVSNPSLPFADEWHQITNAFKPYVRKPAKLDESIKDFNAGFERVARDTIALAANILKELDKDLAVDVEYRSPASYIWSPKILSRPEIIAKPSLRRLHRSDYQSFLNEARLSALAIAIYFAGLKNAPVSDVRMLLLDDILIGLDMAHRKNLVTVLERYFSDWQIVILTYSKAWFERLKAQVGTSVWAKGWKPIVLRDEWVEGENSPRVIVEGSGDLLEMAQRHLVRKDYKAAAVYARSSLEATCNSACAKAHLRVLHVDELKMRKVEHFFIELESRLKELVDEGRRAKAIELLSRIEQARTFVLNRNAHFDVEEEDTLSAEVGTAIEVVKDFRDFLTEQSWEKKNFQSGLEITALEEMCAQLGAARTLAMKDARCQCQGALRAAHDSFWHVYGERLGVLMPIGSKLKALHIWKAAEDQGKLQADVKLRLNAAKGYLYGSVKTDQFDAAKFEEAAKLLEELASAPEEHQ